MANSRVGANTSAMHPSPGFTFGLLIIWTRAGKIKPSVLPEPVYAIPIRSLPCRAIGHVAL